MSLIKLRPYQFAAVENLRNSYRRGNKALLLVLSTGAGKTIVFSFITRGAVAKGMSVLIIAHRLELIRQASRKLSEAGVEHGIIAPGFTVTRDPVQVASIQTISRRPEAFGAFNLIIIDEAHHAIAGQYARLVAAQPTAKLLGVTATPERADGRGLGVQAGGCFDDLVLGPSIAELIKGEFLTPIRVFAPVTRPDLSGVRIKMGDYDTVGLRAAMDVPTLTGDAVEHYARYSPGQPAITFCVSVDHTRNVATAFCRAGWRGAAADGSMAAPERDAAIGGLATGAVQVLCTCDLVSEGLDVPAVSAVLLLRPTKSLGLFLQQVGRGLRPAPGKSHLIVLDHAGCTFNHGMPDLDRMWSLDGRVKQQAAPPTKQCPQCLAVHQPAPACPACGHGYARKKLMERRALQTVAGELSEIDAAALAAIRTTPLRDLLTGRETRAELEQIRQIRGYSPGWVWHTMREQPCRQSDAT
jgi:DNA repair protein RadD